VPVHDISHRAGVYEATRIAQIAIHRDLQAQVVSQTGIAQATQQARRLPTTSRASRFRRDTERKPQDQATPPATHSKPSGDPQNPAPRLDLLA
jgi:hypothetical protein